MAGSFAESEVLNVAHSYLVSSIDVTTLLRLAYSRSLITASQRRECASEPDPYQKAEMFLGHLQRAVNGDSNKYHTFVQTLLDTHQASIASFLEG